MNALELQHVSKKYGEGENVTVALDSADLVVANDELVALLGPSGSGKTTLLSIAGGLLSPTSGNVLVGGDDISELSAKELTAFRGNSIGFVFQQVNLVPFLTAKENLMIVSTFGKVSKSAAEKRALSLLDELGLAHRTNNQPSALSGGERQRVAVGRALMNEPDLVLIDEPTSALDTELGKQVMELIRTEIKGRGTSAVIVTHDTRMVEYCDRTRRIVDGKLEVSDAEAR